ncbi:cilia- and flagella-associated protein 119 [Cynoglossus semilaevis]|uniref:cilia- and flagella-associated protein 119 n=1 Tax=Cynoglossus semilaevis TaxID=244447 RepID=UPI00049530AF|nr:coiled-coil domain-containing protein 189 [Cynoglossus semilaevis]
MTTVEKEIKVPNVLRPTVMLWTDVTYHDMEMIDNTKSIPDLESMLQTVLKIDFDEPKRGVLLELYVQTVLFCRENNFNKEQTSAVLSIVKSVHQANVETPLDNIDQCLKYCNELLLCHSVRRPPFSINIFSYQEADNIVQYVNSTYMRHYKLYKYIFTPQVKLNLTLSYAPVPEPEVVPVPEEVDAVSDETEEEKEFTLGQKTSELKTLIEKEVQEQMTLVSAKLDEKMKALAGNQSKKSDSQQSKRGQKAKKK